MSTTTTTPALRAKRANGHFYSESLEKYGITIDDAVKKGILIKHGPRKFEAREGTGRVFDNGLAALGDRLAMTSKVSAEEDESILRYFNNREKLAALGFGFPSVPTPSPLPEGDERAHIRFVRAELFKLEDRLLTACGMSEDEKDSLFAAAEGALIAVKRWAGVTTGKTQVTELLRGKGITA